MEQSRPAVSILLVEDEVITLEHIFLVLSHKYPHFKIHKALDGHAGLELFRLHIPEIVITDIAMPGMSGIEMASEIHATNPATRFIILSGDMECGMPEKGSGDGPKFDHRLSKPIFLQDLFAAVEKCVEASQDPLAT